MNRHEEQQQQIRVYTQKELRRNAAIVVAIIAVFSCCLVYGVRHLDAIAHMALQVQQAQQTQQEQEPSVATIEEEMQVEEDLEVPIPAEPFYVLLIGSDTRAGTAIYTGKEGEEGAGDDYADVMTLVRIDPHDHLITLVTIPRDTVLVGQDTKINEELLGNHPERSVLAVERLTGVRIDHYLLTTFTTFELLVDALGGVTVDVPKTISFTDPVSADIVEVQEGEDQTLNGAEALVLARVRKDYGDAGDRVRQENVRNLEEAIIRAALENPEAVASVIDELEHYIQTDMNASEIAALVADFYNNADDLKFYSCSGPYDGGLDENGVWVIEEDIDTWTAIMAAVDAGEDPAAVSMGAAGEGDALQDGAEDVEDEDADGSENGDEDM